MIKNTDAQLNPSGYFFSPPTGGSPARSDAGQTRGPGRVPRSPGHGSAMLPPVLLSACDSHGPALVTRGPTCSPQTVTFSRMTVWTVIVADDQASAGEVNGSSVNLIFLENYVGSIQNHFEIC